MSSLVGRHYYEAHVTFTGPRVFEDLVKHHNWRYSAIDGDANLGDGVKQYATRQYNSRLEVGEIIHLLDEMAKILSDNGASVVRVKLEAVLYDSRSSLVRPCDGSECATCPSSN
jgi:hypothetical protein